MILWIFVMLLNDFIKHLFTLLLLLIPLASYGEPTKKDLLPFPHQQPFGDSADTSSEVQLELYAELSPRKPTIGEIVTLTLFGRVNPGKHIYSIHKQGEFSPEPTKIVFQTPGVRTIGRLEESAPKIIQDLAFDLNLAVHIDDFQLKQDISLMNNVPETFNEISGYLLYQICDNRICSLPLQKKFSIPINK